MADTDDPPSPTATHNSPRTWLLTAALSPLAVRLVRLLLAHGDYVVACLPPHEIDHEERGAEFRELINECKSGRKDREGWKDRIRGIRCDGRTMAGCGAAIAEALEIFERIDILLCCKSEGTLWPLPISFSLSLSLYVAVSQRTRGVVELAVESSSASAKL